MVLVGSARTSHACNFQWDMWKSRSATTTRKAGYAPGVYVLCISLLLKTLLLLLVVVAVVRRLDQDILLSFRSSLSFLSITPTEQYILKNDLLSERFTALLLERYQNKKNFTVLWIFSQKTEY